MLKTETYIQLIYKNNLALQTQLFLVLQQLLPYYLMC